VLAAAMLWSLSGVITKRLDLDAGSIAFYRSLFAGLAILFFVRPGQRVFRPVLIPFCVVFATMIGVYIAAVQATTAANAIFLQCTATFWVVPLGLVFLGDRPDRRALLGIGLAMVGIVAIVGFGYDGRPGEGRGIALALTSGVCYAIVAIIMRSLRDLDPLWISAVGNLGGALVLGAWFVATGKPIAVPTVAQGLTLAAFGILQMAIPYALFARGLRYIDAAEAGLIGLLEPVLNPIWVALFHGERPTFATLLGGAFLLGGVALRYLPTTQARPVETDPPASPVQDPDVYLAAATTGGASNGA
jgi:DME family drug/metabolite transporter